MSNELLFGLYIFVLAGFLGHYVIEKVPPLLHTPLMAGTNAISGISLVGSLVSAGGGYGKLSMVLGFIAVICATINTVGGFLITDRMLRMFKKKTPRPAGDNGDEKAMSASLLPYLSPRSASSWRCRGCRRPPTPGGAT